MNVQLMTSNLDVKSSSGKSYTQKNDVSFSEVYNIKTEENAFVEVIETEENTLVEVIETEEQVSISKEDIEDIVTTILNNLTDEDLKKLFENFDFVSQFFQNVIIDVDYNLKEIKQTNIIDSDINTTCKRIYDVLKNFVFCDGKINVDKFENIIKTVFDKLEANFSKKNEYSFENNTDKSNSVDKLFYGIKSLKAFTAQNHAFLDNENVENFSFLVKEEILDNANAENSLKVSKVNVDEIDNEIKQKNELFSNGVINLNSSVLRRIDSVKNIENVYNYKNEIVSQVKNFVQQNISKNGEGSMVLKLRPEGLGELKINFVKTFLGTSVEIITKSADVKNILLDNIKMLNLNLSNVKPENLKITVAETFNANEHLYNENFSQNSNYHNGGQSKPSYSNSDGENAFYEYDNEIVDGIDAADQQMVFSNQSIDVYI